ncbi:MAG: hypothetical protein F4Y46_03680 [Chloroflexi bacterium]|nr:hypothetical protein [Chloroflexota bacterium]
MSDNPPEPVPLEPLGVNSIWPKEDRNFTPWLADNLDRLGEATGLRLVLVKVEKRLGAAGRLDILARQEETEAPVAIENQLNHSDNDHFARLLGYAAASEADTLIWVANNFSDLHLKVIGWLNRDDAIQIHAVRVQGWKIGETQGFSLKQVAGPEPGGVESPGPATWNWTTACAAFYRPLTQHLRSEAGISMIGRGGFRGRYRTFHTGFKDLHVTYATGLNSGHYGQSASDRVAVRISGPHYPELYDRLWDMRDKLAQKAGSDEINWPEKSEKRGYAWLGYTKSPSNLQTLKSDPDTTREWMFKRLETLRNVCQPRLDQINAELTGDRAGGDEDDPR